MSRYAPLTVANHAHRRWRRFANYNFARTSAMVPLVAAELPKAVLSLPIALIPNEGKDTGFLPVALLGLEANRSLFVAPDGRWLGRYIPAALRGYPFRLLATNDQRLVLCVDEESELLTDDSNAEPFFDAAGKLSNQVAEVVEFLKQVEQNRQATVNACAALHAQGLVQPWPVTLQTGQHGERRLDGLYRIEERTIATLSNAALGALRDAGALPLAYCQLLSMQHLGVLASLAKQHAEAPPPLTGEQIFGTGQDDLLHFDWDRPDPPEPA